jgi:hypothetical protein
MNEIILSPEFSIKANLYASQGNAILGIRDSGKSYSAMKVAEELLSAGIPIIAFDPVGIWKFLRVGVNGNPGFPVVVAGGDNPDIPLTLETLPGIIRAAMKENVSLVIDLYSLEHANKSTWIKIVQESIRILLYENKKYGLRHIFLEEAAEFIPQKIEPQHRLVYAELEKLARIGRNSKLGYTIINQRAEEINKAILEISDLVLLHKQTGKNSLLSLKKWFDVLQYDKERALEIMKDLSRLSKGECYAISVGNAVKMKVSKKKTFHPDPSKAETNPLPKASGDVTKFIESMVAAAAVKPESKTDSGRTNEYEVLLKSHNKLMDELRKSRGELTRVRIGIHDATSLIMQKITPMLKDYIEQTLLALPTAAESIVDESKFIVPAPNHPHVSNKLVKQIININRSNDASLSKCERAILSVLAQRQEVKTNKSQVSILSGYSISSSGFVNALSSLHTKGYITKGSDQLSITDDGIKAVGTYDPMPTGQELQNYWYSKLSKAEAAILKALIHEYGRSLNKLEIAKKSGYSETSSGFVNALSKLRTLELIEGYGEMKAAEIFYGVNYTG